jgi:hypothetical protein
MAIQASLPLCVVTSILTGFTLVLSSAFLAYASAQAKKLKDDGRVFPKKYWALAYFGNIVCQFSSYGFQTLSTFYGPVSVAVPMSQTTQLLSNVLIFGAVLKFETITKDISIGTYVNCVAIVLLVFNGAAFPDEKQDILAMLQKTESIIWSSIIVAGAGISLPYIFLLGCTSSNVVTENRTFAFLLLTEVACSIIASTTLKMLILVDGVALAVTIVLTTLSNGMLLYATMLAAVAVPNQTVYVPIVISLYLMATGVTGKIIWEDDIQSTGGYTCVFVLFLLSSYLLVDFEVWKSSNSSFKYGSVVERGFSQIHSRSSLMGQQWRQRRGLTMEEAGKQYRTSSEAYRRSRRTDGGSGGGSGGFPVYQSAVDSAHPTIVAVNREDPIIIQESTGSQSRRNSDLTSSILTNNSGDTNTSFGEDGIETPSSLLRRKSVRFSMDLEDPVLPASLLRATTVGSGVIPRLDQTVIFPDLEESTNGVILPHNQTAIPGLGGSTKQEDCQSETSQNEDFEVFFSASMMDDTATQEVLDDTDDEKSESVYDA